jgi:transposase
MALPSPLPVPPLVVPHPRGALPGNHNAFKHGRFSHRAWMSLLVRKPPRPLPAQAETREKITTTASMLNLALSAWSGHRPTPAGHKLTHIIRNSVDALTSLVHVRSRQAVYLSRLYDLARNAPLLIPLEFEHINVTHPVVFVPPQPTDLNANSTQPSPSPRRKPPLASLWLTPAQWQLIAPLVASLRAELDSRRKYRRHFPRIFSDRFLLNGILWKLATGVRLQDLDRLAVQSGSVPCARACQEYYHHLVHSGTMPLIYDRLYSHLVAKFPLEELVNRDCFRIRLGRVRLHRSQHLTWWKFTALLLFQRMHRTARRLYRLYQLSNPVFRLPRFMPPIDLGRIVLRRITMTPDPLRELHPALLVFPHCLRLKLKYPSYPTQNVHEPLIPIWHTYPFISMHRRTLFIQGKLS